MLHLVLPLLSTVFTDILYIEKSSHVILLQKQSSELSNTFIRSLKCYRQADLSVSVEPFTRQRRYNMRGGESKIKTIGYDHHQAHTSEVTLKEYVLDRRISLCNKVALRRLQITYAALFA